jgi:hypothetical protein
MSWLQIWMFLHILAAIVAFGPAFVFPLIMSQAQKDPKHLPFASLVTITISEKVTLPVALSMAVSGVGLIVVAQIDFFGTAWLIASVVVYVLALLYSVFVQRPAGERMLELLVAMPPGPPPEGQGPPPEIPALGKKLKTGGMILTAATLAVLVLMVWQPGGSRLR